MSKTTKKTKTGEKKVASMNGENMDDKKGSKLGKGKKWAKKALGTKVATQKFCRKKGGKQDKLTKKRVGSNQKMVGKEAGTKRNGGTRKSGGKFWTEVEGGANQNEGGKKGREKQGG